MIFYSFRSLPEGYLGPFNMTSESFPGPMPGNSSCGSLVRKCAAGGGRRGGAGLGQLWVACLGNDDVTKITGRKQRGN